VEEGGLGLTVDQVGYILGATKIAYAVGQMLNGQLAEQLSPRKMLAIGMLGTAALNVAFGFGTAFYFLLFIWACNGYSQSLGWTPCVRIVANWFPVRLRGKAVGLIGTGYQLAAVVTWLVASYAADSLGWRSAFWIPSAMMVCAALVMLCFLKETPQSHAAGKNFQQGDLYRTSSNRRNPLFENVLLTITNRRLWLLGISLGLLNATRYGFLDWGLSHLVDLNEASKTTSTTQAVSVFKEALKYAVLPLGGIGGALIAGWATDRFFGSRRAPVACLLLVMLGLLTLMYDSVARASIPATVGLLCLIGFCIFGPQVLLVGTAPADLARKGTSAAAAGFVNSLGYVGAASGDIITGLSLKYFNWQLTIYLWALWAFASAIAIGLLWNARADESHEESSTS
jgi:sugar phosphate permease